MINRKTLRASKFWDKNINFHTEKEKYIHWLDNPLVQEVCLRKLTLGDEIIPVTDWLFWFKEKYINETFERGLSLGCGDGTLERYAIQNNLCKKIDAFDNSKRSIEIAKNLCKDANLDNYIDYRKKDVNEIVLEEDRYDVVFIGAAAHHFENLEHVFSQLQKGLKKNGLITINEFQWTDKQIKVINGLLDILPEDLKNDHTTNKIKTEITRPMIEAMNALDPSEAIRSEDIIPILSEKFQILERIDYGGTILHLLLYGIVDNFDRASDKDICILKMLAYIEELLISENILSSDFSIIVARNIK